MENSSLMEIDEGQQIDTSSKQNQSQIMKANEIDQEESKQSHYESDSQQTYGENAPKKKKQQSLLYKRAKKELKKVNYDYKQILSSPDFKDLNEEERAALRHSVDNKKHYDKTKLMKQALANNDEQLQQTFNLKFSDELLDVFTVDEKISVLIKQNTEHPIQFATYLKTLTRAPADNFLQMLSKVIANEALLIQKLRIFLGICGLYRKETLDIPHALYPSMLTHLTTQVDVTPKQAIGYLKIVYFNNVGLTGCHQQTIMRFNTKFGRYWDQIIQSLKTEDFLSNMIFNCLPQTCLIMSPPMIEALKKPEKLRIIPPELMKRVLEILVYTFSNDSKAFNQIITKLNESISLHFEQLKSSKFINFLEYLAKRMKEYDAKWYKNINNVKDLLVGVLTMIDNNQVQKEFDDSYLAYLIDQGNSIQEFAHAPVKANDEFIKDDKLYYDLLEMNKDNEQFKHFIDSYDHYLPIDKKFINAFNALEVSVSDAQELCVRMFMQKPHLILNPGIGMGKTTLIIGLALGMSQCLYQNIIVLNMDKQLLFRDYKRMKQIADVKSKEFEYEVSIDLVDGEEEYELNNKNTVTFMTPDQMLQTQIVTECSLLLDEFHLLFFNQNILKYHKLFLKAKHILAVSGCPLFKDHYKLVQTILPNSVVVKFPDRQVFNVDQKLPVLCKNQQQQLTETCNIAKLECKNAPVVIIMSEQQAKAYMKKSEKLRGPTFVLFGEDCDEVKATNILQHQFNRKLQNEQFGIYITNASGGTGTDFISGPEIELNGGVRVIICAQPESYGQLCQFRRRTGRMSNKGSVHHVWVSDTYGLKSEDFMKPFEQGLIDNESKLITSLIRKFKALNMNNEKHELQKGADNIMMNNEKLIQNKNFAASKSSKSSLDQDIAINETKMHSIKSCQDKNNDKQINKQSKNTKKGLEQEEEKETQPQKASIRQNNGPKNTKNQEINVNSFEVPQTKQMSNEERIEFFKKGNAMILAGVEQRRQERLAAQKLLEQNKSESSDAEEQNINEEEKEKVSNDQKLIEHQDQLINEQEVKVQSTDLNQAISNDAKNESQQLITEHNNDSNGKNTKKQRLQKGVQKTKTKNERSDDSGESGLGFKEKQADNSNDKDQQEKLNNNQSRVRRYSEDVFNEIVRREEGRELRKRDAKMSQKMGQYQIQEEKDSADEELSDEDFKIKGKKQNKQQKLNH